MKDKTKKAFDYAGSKGGLYDDIITGTGFIGSIVSNVIWKMDKNKDREYQRLATRPIPDGFSGKLLEVPVGTGILTMPIYKDLTGADITCLDYSNEMMSHAEKRAKDMDIKNISFCQGDVGKLPFEDNTFDIVLSMNGLHVFPDKDAAFSELYRVLKPGGTFCGCTYIEGECKRTDWFIKTSYVPKGYFNPPFDTKDSLLNRLQNMYTTAKVETVLSEGCFECVK